MKSNKVHFLIWRDRPGGIELSLPSLISNIKHFDFSILVLRKSDKDSSVFSTTDIDIKYVDQISSFVYSGLLRFAMTHSSSIFHLFNAGPFILFILRLANTNKIIYSVRGTIYWKTFFQKIMRKIFWKLAITDNMVFLANSEYSKNVFLSKVSSKPYIKVVYNPFDTIRFNDLNRNFSETSNLKICYCGRLAEGKNLFKWVDTAAYILRSFPEYEFNIYGEGPLRDQLSVYIKNKKLDNKIKLRGFRNDIENVYKEHDLMLFLSEFESFGNVAVESILCGTPVIASRIPAMEEIFNDYPEFLVPLNKDLFESTLKKINNYQNLQHITSKAAADFKVRFSLEKHILELEKIYNSFE